MKAFLELKSVLSGRWGLAPTDRGWNVWTYTEHCVIQKCVCACDAELQTVGIVYLSFLIKIVG